MTRQHYSTSWRYLVSWMACFSAVVLGVAVALGCQPKGTTESTEALIKKLGSRNYQTRERATKLLIERPEAVEAVRKAVTSKDPEVVARANHILHQYEQRRVRRAGRYARNGRIDQFVEQLTALRAEKNASACWAMAVELVRKLENLHEKQTGHSISLLFLKKRKREVLTVQTKHLNTHNDRRSGFLFGIASEVHLNDAPHDSIVVSSGPVRIDDDGVGRAAILSGGSVYLNGGFHIVVVSAGDVTLVRHSPLLHALIIARGDVIIPRALSYSHIICGGEIKLAKGVIPFKTKMEQHQTHPFKFVRFFEPEQVGIHVESAKTGVRVKRAVTGRFAKAGLRQNDIITMLNRQAVSSSKIFRRLLRRSVALQKDIELTVIRNGKTHTIRVPRTVTVND